MLFRRQTLFLVSASVFALIVLIVTHFLPIEFTTIARFERRVDEAMSNEGTLRGVGGRDALENIQKTLVQELGGDEAIREVAEKLKLNDADAKPSANPASSNGISQKVIAEIRKGIDIRWDVQSRTVDQVSIAFSYPDRDLAYRIPNALVERYIQLASNKNKERLKVSRDFLQEQVRIHDQNVQEIYQKRVDLETKHVGLLEGAQADMIRREQQSKADLDAVRRLRDIAKQKYARLLAMRNQQVEPTSQPTQVIKGPNPELERLGNELRQYKVELDLAMTLQHMTKEHPAIQTLLSRIRIMEERIRNTPTEVVLQRIYGAGGGADSYAAQVAAAQSEMEILSSEYDRVESQIKGYEKMMADYEPARREYTRLLDQLQNANTTLESWQTRLREVEMALNAEKANRRTNVSSVDLAKRPEAPSFPRFPQMLALAFLGGLIFASTVVFAVHANDRSVATAEDAAQHFQLPVHGVISPVLSERASAIQLLKRRLVMPAATFMMIGIIGIMTLSAQLRLGDPDRYEKWRSSPVDYAKTVLQHRVTGG